MQNSPLLLNSKEKWASTETAEMGGEFMRQGADTRWSRHDTILINLNRDTADKQFIR